MVFVIINKIQRRVIEFSKNVYSSFNNEHIQKIHYDIISEYNIVGHGLRANSFNNLNYEMRKKILGCCDEFVL